MPGLVGDVDKEYVGAVVDVNDPDQRGRFKVTIPELLGRYSSHWILNIESSDCQFQVPKIGSMVRVVAIGNDPAIIRHLGTSNQQGSVPTAAINTLDVSHKGQDSFISSDDTVISEPPAPTRSAYPNNQVLFDSEVIVFEADRGGRINIQWKTLPYYIELHPDGSLVINVKQVYVKTADGQNVAINAGKDLAVKAAQRAAIFSGTDTVIRADNDFFLTLHGKASIQAKGDIQIATKEDIGVGSAGKITMVSTNETTLVASDVDIVNTRK